MQQINENLEWCLAIFKHLLTNPDLAERYSFRAEYFKSTKNGERIYKMYGAMRKLMSDHPKLPYSKNTAYIAYFEYVSPELRDAFYSTNNVDKCKIDEMNRTKMSIDGFMDAVEFAYNTLSEDFIEDKIDGIVKQMSVYCKLMEFNQAYMIYGNDDNLDANGFYEKMAEIEQKSNEKYSIGVGTSSIYEPFDPRLLVKVSTQIYPTNINALNDYLTGGFRKQTLTGFLTKTAGGKTTLLVSLAADAIRKGQNVVFVNLEMNNHEIFSNILSATTQHSYKDIFNNLTNTLLMDEVRSSYNTNVTGEFLLISDSDDDVSSVNFDWLTKQIEEGERNVRKRTGKEDFKYDLIFIDYLYLMDSKKRMNRNSRADQEYQQKVVECHKWAQEKEYAVITVFQGNRGAEQKLNDGSKIDLTDMGDSYAAARDLEYMFAVGRYRNIMEGYDGITLYPLKTRHYDGDYETIYMPYNSFRRAYDTMKSDIIDFDEEEEQREHKPGPKPRPVFDLKNFLVKYPEIRNFPIGTIFSSINDMKEYKPISGREVRLIFDSRGWVQKSAKDFDNPDYDAMKKQIYEAVNEFRSININKPGTPEINITGQSLFEV